MSGTAGSASTGPDDATNSFTYRYETPSNTAGLRELADDFAKLDLDIADGTRDLEIELTARQLNITLDAVKNKLDDKANTQRKIIKQLRNDIKLGKALTVAQNKLITDEFSDQTMIVNGKVVTYATVLKTPTTSNKVLKEIFKNKESQIERKFEDLKTRKEQLYDRLKEVFFPLEAGGMQPVLKYVLIDKTPPTGTTGGTSVPTYTYDENEFFGEKDAEGKILSMQVVVQRPTDKKDARKMESLLKDKMNDYQKLAQHVRDAAGASAVIQGAECTADMFAQLLTAFELGDVSCAATIRNPSTMANFPPHTAASSLSANATADCTGGLLAGELFDSWDQGQKYRFRKVATIATLAVTIYGIVKAFQGDKNWRSFLSVVGLAGVASYIWKGEFKLPHQMVDEGLRGGDTYSWMCELMGIEEKYRTKSPVGGMEGLVVQADGMQQLMTGLTPKILYDEKLIEIKGGKVVLTEHPNGGSSMLAAYLHNYYPNSGRADAANSYFLEQQAGKNPFDDALGILGIRDEIISKPQSTTTFDTYAQAFRYRNDALAKFMKDNDLELKPEFYHSNIVEQYLCARTGRTIDDLVSQGVFKTKDDLPGYIPSFATLPAVDALKALPELQRLFDNIPTSDFAAAVQFLPTSTQLSLRWDDLYALPGALGTDLKNYQLTPEEQTRIEHLLTQFFSQVMGFSHGKLASEALNPTIVGTTMKEAFAHHKVFLENYKALGEFANAGKFRPNIDQDPVMVAVLGTNFSDPTSILALQTSYPILFPVGTPVTRASAFGVLVSSGSLQFNVAGFPLLAGIDLNDSDVLAAEASLTGSTTLTGQEKREVALWKVAYDRRLQDKLPTEIGITAIGAKLIEWKAYGQVATIDFSSPGKVLVGGIEILTDDGVPRTIDELIQIAHLATMMVGSFQFMAKTGSPWEEDNGRIDFKYNNTLTDSFVDLWSNLGDISQARKALYRNIDTTLLSEDGIRKYFPALMKGKLLESFCTDMNILSVWNAASFNNVDHFRKRAQIVQKVVTLHNQGSNANITLVMDPRSATDVQFFGSVMKLQLEDGGVTKSIELDVLHNQVGNYGLATIPDLEMATDIAITALKAKVAIAYAAEAVKNSVTSLPAWMISVIGEDNWADIKNIGRMTKEHLKDILGGIGGLAGTMLKASKDFLLAILTVLGWPAAFVSFLTGGFSNSPAEDLVKNRLFTDGIVDHNTWGRTGNAKSVVNDRPRLSASNYTDTDIQLMLYFNDWTDETITTLKVLQKAKKHNMVRYNILDFSTGKPLFTTGGAERIANSNSISDQDIFELANLMGYPGPNKLRKDLEGIAEAKRDMTLLVEKLKRHIPTAPTGIVAGTRAALTAGVATYITGAAITLPNGETYIASSAFTPTVAPGPSITPRNGTLDIEFTVKIGGTTVPVRHKIHFSD